MSQTFELTPSGPFDLDSERNFFGGWPAFEPDPAAVVMAFPVEGWRGSAAVVLRQPSPDHVTGEVHGVPAELAPVAWEQATAVLSLDVDGAGFPQVGHRDPDMGRLGAEHGWMRPVLFHSPYEAACNFVIGQRISIAQARALRARMAAESGEHIEVGGAVRYAFPGPQALLQVDGVRGLSSEKVTRLHGIAGAALDGRLDRKRLRAMAAPEALAELTTLPGVGRFSSQGILYRGAGLVDEIPDDDVTKQAVERFYALDQRPGHDAVLRRAEAWRPYRMWSLVLLHVWVRGQGGLAPRDASQRRPAKRA